MRNLLLWAIGLSLAMFGVASAGDGAASAEPGPGKFVVVIKHLTETGVSKEDENAAMTGHIGYLNELFDQGVLYMAGPYSDSYMQGIAIVIADSADAARELISGDPSIQAGIMEILEVHPYWDAFNAPEGRRFTQADMEAMIAQESGQDEQEGAMEMAPGGVSFIQVPSSDVAASSAFYSALFGWEIQTDDTVGITFYTAPGGIMGEFSTESKPAAPMTGPTFFINCDSVKAKLAEVEAAGGSIYQPEMQLPQDWGWIAVIGDPSGNAVGLWSIGE